MLTPIQNRLIKIHLKNLLVFFIEAINHEEFNKVNEYKNMINHAIYILTEKSDLPTEVKEKLCILKISVNNESKDILKKYEDLVKSL